MYVEENNLSPITLYFTQQDKVFALITCICLPVYVYLNLITYL